MGVTLVTGESGDLFDAALAALASTTPEGGGAPPVGLGSPALPGILEGGSLVRSTVALEGDPVARTSEEPPAVVDRRAVASGEELPSPQQDSSLIDPAAIVVAIAAVTPPPAAREAQPLPDASPHAHSPGPPAAFALRASAPREGGPHSSRVRVEPNREMPAYQPVEWTQANELDQGMGLADETVQPEESESQPQLQAELSAPRRLPPRLDRECAGTRESAAVSDAKPPTEASMLPEAAPRTEIASSLEATQHAQVTARSAVTPHTAGAHGRIPPAARRVARPEAAGTDHVEVVPPGLRADDPEPLGRAEVSRPAPIRADAPPPAPGRVADVFFTGTNDRPRVISDEPTAGAAAQVEALVTSALPVRADSDGEAAERRSSDGQLSSSQRFVKATNGAADLRLATQGVSMLASAILPLSPQTAAEATLHPDTALLNEARATNVDRLVQAMRVSSRGGAWEAVVRLEPEHLGPVTIAIRVQGTTVSATVEAQAAPVRQWLDAQRDEVRARLGEHGLELERFDVLDDRERSAEQERRAPQQAYRRSPRRLASTATFEVTV